MPGIVPPGFPIKITPKTSTATPEDGAAPAATPPVNQNPGSERAWHDLMKALGSRSRSRLAQVAAASDSILSTIANGR